MRSPRAATREELQLQTAREKPAHGDASFLWSENNLPLERTGVKAEMRDFKSLGTSHISSKFHSDQYV